MTSARRIGILAVATVLLPGILVCCGKDEIKQAVPPEDDTTEEPGLPEIDDSAAPSLINALIPDAVASKVSLTPGAGEGLALAWEAGDCLTVIASGTATQTEKFTIVEEGMQASKAGFTGNPLVGDSFTVLYPGDYASVEEIDARSYAGQVQDGNGSTAHLRWNASVSGLERYGSIVFAEREGQEYKCNGVVKFSFDVPERFETVVKLSLSAASPVFHTTNDPQGPMASSLEIEIRNLSLTEQDRQLDAYMMVPWTETTFAEGETYSIGLYGPDGQFESFEKTAPEGGITIGGGRVTSLSLDAADLQEPLFWGGDGTRSNPYLIKTVTHLRNMTSTIMEVAGDSTLYFRLAGDIDMASVTDWLYRNNSDNKVFPIDFDGAGHTILNFSMTQWSASLFGVLVGSVHDLNFKDAVIQTNASSASYGGLLAYSAGRKTDVLDAPVSVKNVNVVGLTVTGTGSPVGGLFGRISNGTVENCHISGLQMTTQAEAGGIAGKVNEGTVEFNDCSVEGSICTSGNYAGGLVGYVNSDCNISGCEVKNTDVSAATFAGGAVGHIYQGDVRISTTSVSGSATATGSNAGGLVAGCNNAAVDNTLTVHSCTSSADLKGNQNVGGIIGRAYIKCDISSCRTSGKYESVATSGNSYVAGIVANLHNGVIKQCASTADISGKSFLGGILGALYWGDAEVSECAFDGSIGNPSDGQAIGGVVGVVYNNRSLVLRNSFSAGSISNPKAYTGGLVGMMSGAKLTLENCYSRASVKAGTGSVNGLGGIVGGCNNTTAQWSVSKCLAWNSSLEFNINSGLSYDGAIIGQVHSGSSSASTSISNCWYENGLDYTSTGGHTPGSDADLSASPGKTRYDGKPAATGVKCSEKAEELGWDGDIWNLEGDFPQLKNIPLAQ